MEGKKVLIVVPVYNEADRIMDTIKGLKKVQLIDEILVIDDGSTDDTGEIVKKLDVKLITLANNRGKGYAMRKAIKEAKYDYIGFVDGDLGESSSEVEKLIKPVISNETDFTIAKFPKASANTNTKGGFGLVKKLARNGVRFLRVRKWKHPFLAKEFIKGKSWIQSNIYQMDMELK